VVVCHPHPEYGGDMDSPVVLAAVRGCLDAGWAALRFNFAGVGGSSGRYSGGPEEVGDVLRAVEVVRQALPSGTPLGVVGYSFGAWAGARAACDVDGLRSVVAIAPPLGFFDWGFIAGLAAPLAIVVGDRDQYCPADQLQDLATAGRAEVITLANADHFLVGRGDEVAEAVRRRL
jgi:alpha/beta superfamily hydrolase